MQLFNIGALEFLFILLLALIILGPEKAIKTAGDLARWVRDLTKTSFWRDLVSTSREIQNLPKTLLNDSELQSTYNDLNRATGEIKSSYTGTGKIIDDEIKTKEDKIMKDPDPDTPD